MKNSSNIERVKQLYIPKPIKTNKGIEYYNLPCAFDIETTSSYSNKLDNASKIAFMYIWQVSIDGEIFIGRTWEEFDELYHALVDHFMTDEMKRLVIYVHNLSFEFQFICKRFNWLKVFSLEKRKPVQAVTIEGIEFRCSYLLSGFSLENLGKQLQKHKVEKCVGGLDYSKVRHSKTPLSEKEIEYCVNDVKVVTSYIRECIENDGNITKIPLTKTGYVRNYCRNQCFTKPHAQTQAPNSRIIEIL